MREKAFDFGHSEGDEGVVVGGRGALVVCGRDVGEGQQDGQGFTQLLDERVTPLDFFEFAAPLVPDDVGLVGDESGRVE